MAQQTDVGSSSIIGNLIKGALAGAAGVWALDQVTEWFTSAEKPEALEQEAHARPDAMDPAHVLANKIAEATGTEISPKQPHPSGMATHYAIGILPAAAYSALRGRRGLNLGRGILMGLGMYAFQDQGLNYVLGLSGKPNEYPWQAHIRGLVGHLAYGTITEGTLSTLDEIERRSQDLAWRGRRRLQEEQIERRARQKAERPAEEKSEERPPHV